MNYDSNEQVYSRTRNNESFRSGPFIYLYSIQLKISSLSTFYCFLFSAVEMPSRRSNLGDFSLPFVYDLKRKCVMVRNSKELRPLSSKFNSALLVGIGTDSLVSPPFPQLHSFIFDPSNPVFLLIINFTDIFPLCRHGEKAQFWSEGPKNESYCAYPVGNSPKQRS